ncbi:MAG: glycosyltransferase family 2 protein, partial [Carboxydocellales bacterium]
VLRFTETTKNIYHIPKILYHWRTIPQSTASNSDSKGYAHLAGLRALQEALLRRGESGWVENASNSPNRYRVHYHLEGNPLISILIPTRNMAHLLRPCLESIYSKSIYLNYEVIVIDNGSDEQDTLNLFTEYASKEPNRFRVEKLDIPFDFSKLNNTAVRNAKGKLILLLNNDIEVITPNWLEQMASFAMRPTIGAVGAMLLYPDETIQHAGVVMGIGGVAGHSHKYFNKDEQGYFDRLILVSNYAAVTGACLMVKKELYEKIGGLDENMQVAFNDVDFCLKLLKKDLYNVVLPTALLYHHESKSRGYEDTPDKKKRFQGEVHRMQECWGDIIANDPFYNPNLTREREDFSLRSPI